ncbi:hypothetical protein ACVWZK_009413 [Bradyrhizobium sp. GM0.4]|uniref:hypothetical protein n=1 Tax=unclassified Bradyrhizobium TaxID=2631580 RepID=UPI001FFB9D42|nr:MULTISPECIES: hypothetical protein [unclassified Bradyrhizobium]MCK1343198.1 hypothetical protein [Bradyrhizobium sp. CW11]MCK1592942.1 hypothetical protein [Bradyrhizobium sp. 169]
MKKPVTGLLAGRTLKLRAPALIATWLSAFVHYRPHLDPGERGVIQVLAADRGQAKILRYTKAFFSKVPMLTHIVERETQFGLELSNSVAVEVTTSFRSVRGRTTVAALADAVLREAEPIKTSRTRARHIFRQRLRAQIANLVNERSRMERSEPKEKKATVASFVKELAAKGRPRIFVGHNGQRGVRTA